ncbi:hypothetical protein JCM15640A_05480 [Hoylesella timonensis 4401737 = DSM 22865 = JCM 15640]|uniref:DUF1573 domain-containing protein n=1 Tax=Hoylesella timonensis TaxID=386414 RepID=UPI00046A4F06|nr:DUF1573 domain-containing protein [Hoylesella timonensis]
MRKVKNIVSLVFLLVFTNLNCTNQIKSDTSKVASTSSEDLYVEQKHCYLGEISKEKKDSIDFEFIVKNLTDSLIRIDKIDVSCNCLSIKNYNREILPHNSTVIKGKAGLENRNGHMSKSIFVNYSKDKTLILRVIADIK